MRRCGGQAELAGAGEGIDGALALGQQVQQLQALSTAQGLADPGELIEQLVLGGPIAHIAFSNHLWNSVEHRWSARAVGRMQGRVHDWS